MLPDPHRHPDLARLFAPRHTRGSRTLARDWPMDYEWPPRGRNDHACGGPMSLPA